MYTECPSCHKQHTITVKKLRVSQREFLCNRCYTTFDPVELLNESSLFKIKSAIKTEPELEGTGLSFSEYWKYGVVFFVILFLLQVYFLKGADLVQNKTLRPWFEKISSVTGYSLAPYKNSNEFSVAHVSFAPTPEGVYVLRASLVNQADFSQNQPSVKLILKDFVGKVFAERTFHPEDFSRTTMPRIEPEMSTEIELIIASPPNKVGGYHFELI